MAASPVRILMPSIVDPASHPGGAGAVTRGLLEVLGRAPLHARIRTLPVPAAASSWAHTIRQGVSLARSWTGPLPAKPAFTWSRALRDAVRRHLAEARWELLILNGSDLLWLLDEVPCEMPVLLIAHNLEHSLYRSQIARTGWPSWLLQGWLDRDRRRLESFELEGLRRVRNVIFLSSTDAAEALESCPQLHTLVVPPLFDEPRVPRTPRTVGHGLVEAVFLADFSWWPNRDGFHWFMDRVLPHTGDTMRLHLAGKGSRQLSSRHPRVVKHGFVPSTRELWDLADLLVCPIFGGGGVRVKLAHALYQGVPVAATTFASRGLPFASSECITLLDDAEQWIRFFRSGEARKVAASAIPPAVSDAYSLPARARSIHEYVSSVLDGTTARVALRTGAAHR